MSRKSQPINERRVYKQRRPESRDANRLFGSLFHDRIQGDSAASHADALLYEVALYHRLSDMKKGWNAH